MAFEYSYTRVWVSLTISLHPNIYTRSLPSQLKSQHAIGQQGKDYSHKLFLAAEKATFE